MKSAWIVLLALAPWASQTQVERVEQALARGDFDAALAEASSGTDALERLRLERRVRHAAGDLDGALEVGLDALERAPHDLELLVGSADAAFALGLAGRTRELAERLAEVARALDDGAPNAAWWREKGEQYLVHAEQLDQRRQARERGLARARIGSFAALALVLGAIVVLGRRP